MFGHPDRARGAGRRRLTAAVLPGAVATLVLGGWAVLPVEQAAAATLSNTPNYSLPLALQQSWYFYDAEESGPSRSMGQQPLEWRGDSELEDAKIPLKPMANNDGVNLSSSFISANKAVLDPDGDGAIDVSGGFHDAGDHVKFGLPQSYAAAMLAWGMYLFPDAYKKTNTWDHGMEETRWFSDYLLRSTFRKSSGEVVAFSYQVGEGAVDHDYWGPPELQPLKTHPRPAYLATSETPASDQTASAAAALAMQYLITKGSDEAYAKKCLDTARALYDFSLKNTGLGYSGGFYGSSFYEDEMAWGAGVLYEATGEQKYLDDIVSADSQGNYTGYLKKIVKSTNETWQNIWVMSWDTKWGGVFSLIDPKVQANSKVSQAVKDAVHYFNKWHVEYWSHVPHDASNDSNHLSNTPGGLAWLTTWGSARYNTAAQFEALSYRKNFPDDPKSVKFSDWAMGQMNYIMGDNPLNRSFIVGFGSTTPVIGSQVGGKATAAQHPHHAAAHGSLTNNQDEPPTHRHTLWGALVGGPDQGDKHSDITTDYVLNEVAVDYNAALPGSLAGLYQYYGQNQKMTDFTPPPEPEEMAYYSTAKLNQASNQGTQVTVNVHNLATHPPHFQDTMSLRYFFSIKPLVQHGQGIDDVSTPVYYDAGKSFDGVETSLGKPVRWGGEKSCLYYVPIDWTGNPISGTRAFQFGVNSGISDDFKFYWDSEPSPSFAGLKDGKYTSTPDPNIPVYIDGKKVFGDEPSQTADLTCGASGEDPGGSDVTATAQYQVTNTDATTNQITNKLQLTNTGAKAALSDFTLRYWFTGDEGTSFTYACDYTPIGCKNVVGAVHEVSPAAKDADRYLEIGFTSAAGQLKVGGTTGPIQSRLYRADHGTMSQSNDYSFKSTATSLTDSTKITVYYKGKLVYGTPPS